MSISQPMTLLRIRQLTRVIRRLAGARATKSLREFMMGHAIGA